MGLEINELADPASMIAAIANRRVEIDEEVTHLARLYRLAVAATYYLNMPTTFREIAPGLGLSTARASELTRVVPENSAVVFREWGKALKILNEMPSAEEVELQLLDMREKGFPEEGHRALYQAHITFCRALGGDEISNTVMAQMRDDVEVGCGHLAIWRGRSRHADQTGQ